MNNTQLHEAISNAFYNLSQTNAALYDYWLSELYTPDGDLAHDKWNEDTLDLMETDVMMQLA
jgi:hypothetical protein